MMPSSQELFDACKRGDTESVRQWLSSKKNKRPRTPLKYLPIKSIDSSFLPTYSQIEYFFAVFCGQVLRVPVGFARYEILLQLILHSICQHYMDIPRSEANLHSEIEYLNHC